MIQKIFAVGAVVFSSILLLASLYVSYVMVNAIIIAPTVFPLMILPLGLALVSAVSCLISTIINTRVALRSGAASFRQERVGDLSFNLAVLSVNIWMLIVAPFPSVLINEFAVVLLMFAARNIVRDIDRGYSLI